MKLFEGIIAQIAASDSEYAKLNNEYTEVKRLLLAALGNTVSINPFGSFLRRTRLSTESDPGADVDVLISQTYSTHEAIYGKGISWDKWANDIESRLINFIKGTGFELEGEAPFLTLRSATQNFDLVLSLSPEDEKGEKMIILKNGLQSAFSEDIAQRYMGGGLISNRDNTFAILMSNQNQFNLEVLDESYLPHFWRAIVLVWKYWRVNSQSSVTSWMIELNVIERLEDPNWLEEGANYTMLRFVSRFFQDKRNYHFQLFESEPNFLSFINGIVAASQFADLDKTADAIRTLATLFPFEVLSLLLDQLDDVLPVMEIIDSERKAMGGGQ